MAIEETITRFVAAADWTDECAVLLSTRKKRTKMTPAEAVTLAGELIGAASAALDAARDALHPIEPSGFDLVGGGITFTPQHVHPECVAGKCGNCDGQVLTIDDEWAPCTHACHKAAAA